MGELTEHRPDLDAAIKVQIETLMSGRRWAYAALPSRSGAGLGLVTACKPGAIELPRAAYHVGGMDEALCTAEALNAERGLLDWQALAIALGALPRRPCRCHGWPLK